MMTKKHFEAVARAIRSTLSDYSNGVVSSVGLEAIFDVSKNLATEFGNDNPLFDPKRFLSACGFDESLF